MALSASFKIPGAFITMIFGAGSQSPLEAPRTVVIIDYGTKGELNKAIPLSSADEAGNTFGFGSHIHLATKAFFDEYTFGTLYGCRYAEAGGGIAAEYTLTAVGNATLGGSLYLDINGIAAIEIPVAAGDLQAAILQNAVNALNIRGEYPATAAFTANAVDVGGVTYSAADAGVTVRNVAATGSQATAIGVIAKAITVTLGAAGTPVSIGTGLSGLVWTANQTAVRVRYVDPAAVQASSVTTVAGTDITVTLKNTTGAAVDATAAEVRTSVLASAPALALLESAPSFITSPGSGVVVPFAFLSLPWAVNATQENVRLAVVSSAAALALLASVAVTTPPGNATATVVAATAITRPSTTFTWKQKGERSNQFKFRTSLGGVTGIVFTATNTVTGANDGNPTTALDALANADYDIMVVGANTSNATTGITPFVTYVNQRSGPFVGLRGVVIAASLDTYATVVALALSQNAHRLQLAWCRNADLTTVEIAAKMAAVRSQYEGQDPAWNFDYQKFASFRGPYSVSDRISVVEANNGLNNGVTSIGFDRQGHAFVWRSITTRFQDALGAPDYRVLDTSKVAVVDYIADLMASDYLVKGFQQMKVRNDTGDGKPQFRIITPKIVRDWILGILYNAQNNEPVVLENVDLWLNNLIVQVSSTVPGRIECRIPIDVIEGAHQFDITLLQNG